MAIDIATIKRLKELTGVGLTDAKAALVEANGDFDTALAAMRKKGQTKAEKRGEREARSGVIGRESKSEQTLFVAGRSHTCIDVEKGVLQPVAEAVEYPDITALFHNEQAAVAAVCNVHRTVEARSMVLQFDFGLRER